MLNFAPPSLAMCIPSLPMVTSLLCVKTSSEDEKQSNNQSLIMLKKIVDDYIL
jgi:hypothetical protein